jgi:hypothetical protein
LRLLQLLQLLLLLLTLLLLLLLLLLLTLLPLALLLRPLLLLQQSNQLDEKAGLWAGFFSSVFSCRASAARCAPRRAASGSPPMPAPRATAAIGKRARP